MYSYKDNLDIIKEHYMISDMCILNLFLNWVKLGLFAQWHFLHVIVLSLKQVNKKEPK